MNQPDLTENSPKTIPAVMLRGVDSIFGVFTAARRRPSSASSKIRSCKMMGTLILSFIAMNDNQSGSIVGCMVESRYKTGTKYVMSAIRALVRRR